MSSSPSVQSSTASFRSDHNLEARADLANHMEKQAESLSAATTKQEEDGNHKAFLVDWHGTDDPENPLNWSTARKHGITLTLSFAVVVVTFASSVYSSASSAVAKHFGVSDEVGKLGITLFLCGYAIGPLAWGPLSERQGRKPPMLISYLGFVLFSLATATAKDLQTVLICRFFSGVFGCGPLSIAGGAMADYSSLEQRGIAIAIYSFATFAGPTFGPILGSFIVESHLGWRWTEYLTAIVGSAFLLVLLVALPETYAKRILQKRAEHRRLETRQWAWHAQLDEEAFDARVVVTKYLTRPIVMLVVEPMILLLSIYVAFIYGILYLLFGSLPVHYVEVRGWSEGVGSLPFLALLVGCGLGCLVMVGFNPRYVRTCKLNNSQPVPEERLLPMIVGAVVFPVGCLWYAWTTYASVHWIVPTLALVPIGCGIILLFLQALNYLIDAYLAYANSALAANSLLRSLFGAGFPLFGSQMMVNLGLQWANTVIGLIGVALLPIPILFYIYGKRLRRSSKFAT
ncbi:uncharacterized protein PAN0_001c0001 [Moesziomyces antarcticus]|uniref:Related to fluconazole resistance protein n=1 Tax=Pseudozyma antarctica TaxID=84753 RepID=A0A5C3FD09_PSEA2|nr:uncharacterized protein PAN0_001c0001 [Moesziomyces antarcticus]GAK61808.1 conserved hypothetical protein [Moesziomyces antarcticus]SPO42323.1 related to fluconazole resistance protein [Moesziomyces antarcticus]